METCTPTAESEGARSTKEVPLKNVCAIRKPPRFGGGPSFSFWQKTPGFNIRLIFLGIYIDHLIYVLQLRMSLEFAVCFSFLHIRAL